MVHALTEKLFKRFTDGGDLNSLIQVLQTHPQFTLFPRKQYAEIYFKGFYIIVKEIYFHRFYFLYYIFHYLWI